MSIKITTKIGDSVKVMGDDQSKMFTGDDVGFAQLMQTKGALGISPFSSPFTIFQQFFISAQYLVFSA